MNGMLMRSKDRSHSRQIVTAQIVTHGLAGIRSHPRLARRRHHRIYVCLCVHTSCTFWVPGCGLMVSTWHSVLTNHMVFTTTRGMQHWCAQHSYPVQNAQLLADGPVLCSLTDTVPAVLLLCSTESLVANQEHVRKNEAFIPVSCRQRSGELTT